MLNVMLCQHAAYIQTLCVDNAMADIKSHSARVIIRTILSYQEKNKSWKIKKTDRPNFSGLADADLETTNFSPHTLAS